jgi:hypothetical protein
VRHFLARRVRCHAPILTAGSFVATQIGSGRSLHREGMTKLKHHGTAVAARPRLKRHSVAVTVPGKPPSPCDQ